MIKKTIKKMIASSFLVICFLSAYGQNNIPFAELVSLVHDTGAGGSVEFALTGNPDEYNYYWDHGETSLALTGLAPGTYTLVVQNFYGCVEEFEVTINSVFGCTLGYDINDGVEPCTKILSVELVKNGVPIDESELVITWSDGALEGLTRAVNSTTAQTLCVVVSAPGYEDSCQDLEHCFDITPGPNCFDGPECELLHTVSNGKAECEQIITIEFKHQGKTVPESDLQITWSDKGQYGLVRPVIPYFTQRYCVEISMRGEVDACQNIMKCIAVSPLRGCEKVDGSDGRDKGSRGRENSMQNLVGQNTLNAFPNPFHDEVQVDFESTQNGVAVVNVLSIAGQKLFSQQLDCEEGMNTYVLDAEAISSSGVLFLQVQFPSGETQIKRIARIDQN